MNDLQEQLANLREKMERIMRASRAEIPAPHEFLSGEVVETAYGRHFETEKLYEHHRRHGHAGHGGQPTDHHRPEQRGR